MAVSAVLETTGIDFTNGAGIPELVRYQEHFRQYKIVVHCALSNVDIMFEGQVDSPKRLNILYDAVERHYHVIAQFTGAMAKEYVCKECSKECKRDIANVCDQTFAIAWSVRRAHSRSFESPAKSAIGTFETPRVSRTTSCAHRIGNLCANLSGVARRADGS